MPGVRIQHPTERSCTFLLVDGRRPLQGVQDPCPRCLRVHTHKTYHLDLDEAGAAIVSTTIAERLKSLPLQGGFAITGEITAPPIQRIVIGAVQVVRRGDLAPLIAHPSLMEPV